MTTIVPKSPFLIAGAFPVLVIALVGMFAPLIAPHDPQEIQIQLRHQPPLSTEFAIDRSRRQADGEFLTGRRFFLLGTDPLGRDILSRLIFGFRLYIYSGVVGLLLGTVGSLVLVVLWSTRTASSHGSQLRPKAFLSYSLLRLSAVTYIVSSVVIVLLLKFLAFDVIVVIALLGASTAVLPASLIYQSVRGELASHSMSVPDPFAGVASNSSLKVLALRQGLALAPLNFSLVVLMGIFIEFLLPSLPFGRYPPDLSLGLMFSQSIPTMGTAWWSFVFPLAILFVGFAAFLAIVLPIRRVQKQAAPDAQHELLAMA